MNPSTYVTADRAKQAPRGIVLPCPRCGDGTASIRLHLNDLDHCTCQDCDAEFSLAEVRAIIAQWQPVLAWVDEAPSNRE